MRCLRTFLSIVSTYKHNAQQITNTNKQKNQSKTIFLISSGWYRERSRLYIVSYDQAVSLSALGINCMAICYVHPYCASRFMSHISTCCANRSKRIVLLLCLKNIILHEYDHSTDWTEQQTISNLEHYPYHCIRCTENGTVTALFFSFYGTSANSEFIIIRYLWIS